MKFLMSIIEGITTPLLVNLVRSEPCLITNIHLSIAKLIQTFEVFVIPISILIYTRKDDFDSETFMFIRSEVVRNKARVNYLFQKFYYILSSKGQ